MASLDVLVRTSHLPTWDKGVSLSGIALDGGGPVATALVAAQRLGISTGFIGTYGSDPLGEIKKQTLVDYNVDTTCLIRRPGPENQAVLVLVNADTGERVFSGVKVGSKPLAPSELNMDYLLQADYLHVDGYHIDAALQAATWMNAAGKKVMLDGSATRGPVSTKMVDLVRKADYLICGTGFGPAVTGETNIWHAGKALISMGPTVVVQTEGKVGCFTTTAEGQFHTPIFEVSVVDTTGAGDVFHGAFLAGLIKGWKLQDIVTFSSAVAAIKCTQLGGRRGIPTFEEAMTFLSERGITL
jgi:sugar/nucleoside kinase (ribokinase family)